MSDTDDETDEPEPEQPPEEFEPEAGIDPERVVCLPEGTEIEGVVER